MNSYKKNGAGKVGKMEPKMCNPSGAGDRKEENVVSQPGKKKYGSNMMSPVAKEGRRVPYGGETY
jgi:hypothetical protein